MIYLCIKITHVFAVFIYGGFLFIDNLALGRMKKDFDPKDYAIQREYFMKYVRLVVPKALLVAVFTGIYLFYITFGSISPSGLSHFQILLGIKGFLGLWLGLRGILQVFFSINPMVFKSHLFPFILVIVIIVISQIMYRF